eukprot:TRINITY_DN7189_c0_g1_i1.p1 TRINITY_DN7189_c0_g1~~TRINITY_DN7189_c0_g1_i1.p1  ORF type:complete len:417 (+),score=121.78 TRINITY_DN7189_c0_g1_i1:227-1477(+)
MDRMLITIPDFSIHNDGVVIFNFRLEYQGEVWTVKHRFSNIRTLRDSLRAALPDAVAELPKFPPRSLRTKATGSTNTSFLEARRDALQTWARAAAASPAIASSSTFKGFFRVIDMDDSRRVFGRSLEEVMSLDVHKGRELPLVMEKSIDYVRKKGLEEVGIFRISAMNSNLCEVKRAFNMAKEVQFDEYDDGVHVAAGVLKLFLREMPNCLLTYERYEEITAVLERPDHEWLGLLTAKLRELPAINKAVLCALIELLREVIAHSDTNKMTVTNIVTIFAPTILSTEGSMLDSPDVYKVSLILLQNSQQVVAALRGESAAEDEGRVSRGSSSVGTGGAESDTGEAAVRDVAEEQDAEQSVPGGESGRSTGEEGQEGSSEVAGDAEGANQEGSEGGDQEGGESEAPPLDACWYDAYST